MQRISKMWLQLCAPRLPSSGTRREHLMAKQCSSLALLSTKSLLLQDQFAAPRPCFIALGGRVVCQVLGELDLLSR